MRLGQLARKYDLSVQDIVEYLEDQTGEKFHPNAKLYDAIETMVFEHFELQPVVQPKEEQEPTELTHEVETADQEEELAEDIEVPEKIEDSTSLPMTAAEDIALVNGELEVPVEDTHEPNTNEEVIIEEMQEEKPAPSEDEVIQTDRLIEILESGEMTEGLEKIKLIKAPKRELEGLKVVGKIDLPEPKPKPEKQEKEADRKRNQRPKLSEEEREKRRLRAKKKQEEYEARKEKRRKEKERKELQARKEAHYRQKLEKTTPTAPKHKPRLKVEQEEMQPSERSTPTPPKTVFGKFWKWLNT